MAIAKLFSLITPLVVVSLMGVIIIFYGFIHPAQENNILQFLFGVPIAVGALGLHFLVRRLARYDTLHVWIVEGILVAFMYYVFTKS